MIWGHSVPGAHTLPSELTSASKRVIHRTADMTGYWFYGTRWYPPDRPQVTQSILDEYRVVLIMCFKPFSQMQFYVNVPLAGQ